MLSSDQKYFEIEISNPIYTGSSNIILFDQNRSQSRDAHGSAKGGQHGSTPPKGKQASGTLNVNDPNANVLELSCNPTKPATYICFVILKSLDRTDIRLYEYKLNVIPQKIKAQLEFRVPARGQVA